MSYKSPVDNYHPLYQEDLDHILSVRGLEHLIGSRFLITGATGMIGTCLIDALMRFNQINHAGITVYAIGRSRDKAISRLGGYFSSDYFVFIEQDVRESLPSTIGVDYIIPLASNTHPLAYSQHPVETIQINVQGAENALKKAMECGATVLYPSSVEIYGNGDVLFTEDYTGQLNLGTSRACYTESKRACEALCQSYIAEYGVNCKIVRLSRLFGPTMLMNDTKASSQFIIKALAGENIILKSKGDQLFSYTYISDAVQAMLFVLLKGQCGQAYNIASEKCNVYLKDFANACAKLAGKSVVFDIPTEIERKGYSVASKALLSVEKLSELGWKASYSFIDALERTYKILSDR